MSAVLPKLTLQAGGAVKPQSVYIVRPSDDELFELLRRGEYANVLCSRQMGKTSLLKRTKARLAELGYRTVELDLAGYLGTPPNATDWFQGLLQGIADQLGLELDIRAWWQASRAITTNQRLIQFLREKVAAKSEMPVVIFLDEIDSTLKLPYTDDFFVAIRSLYNDRASEPLYEKLVFCLVGVATPNELIKDRRTTPYNIGKTLELPDFDPAREDLKPLYKLLSSDEAQGEAIVREVLRYTGGQPYLTLRLCEEVAAKGGATPAAVARQVNENFASLDAVKRDVHFEQILRFINDRVEDKLSTLELYRRVLAGKPVPDQTTPAHINLKLTGLVKRGGNATLVVRNPIYRQLFTDAWAKAAMPPVERRVRSAQRLAMAAIVLLLVAAGLWLEVIYPRERINTLNQVLNDYKLAQVKYRELKRVPFYAGKADELMAQFYERRALRDEQLGKRDNALLWRLNAHAVRPNDSRARALNGLIAPDYPKLLVTFRPLSAATTTTERAREGNNPQSVGQSGYVVTAISPDGKKIMTGGANGIAQLWDAETRQPIGQPMRHDAVLELDFPPGREGDPIPPSHPGTIIAVAFSPDGQRLLTGSNDGRARVWSAETGQALARPLRHEGVVNAVAFSPDGRCVLTGSSDGTARLWDVQTGQVLAQPLRHEGAVNAVAFSPDGRRVLTGSYDKTVRLWSAETGQTIGQPMRHPASVLAVAFSPDGRRVLTGSDDGTARLWSAETRQALGQPLRHGDRVWAVAFSPDGRRVLTGSDDKTARLWSAETGQALGQPLQHEGSVRAVAFSHDGREVLTGSLDGTARLWSTKDGQPFGQPLRHEESIDAVAFSPDGRTLVTGFGFAASGMAQLWRITDGKPLGPRVSHELAVSAVAFSPNGSAFATGSGDDTARVWWVADGQPLCPPLHHAGSIDAIIFSPDGGTLATGSDDRTVRLWRVADGQQLISPLRHDHQVCAVGYNPNGDTLVTGSRDGTVRIWRVADGQPLGLPLHHSSWINAVAFSPDGRTVLAATKNWLHIAWFDGAELHPLNSRLLPGEWWASSGLLLFDQQTADLLKVVVSLNRNPQGETIQVAKLRLDQTPAPPVTGEMATLKYWEERLGLRINEAGEIVPRY